MAKPNANACRYCRAPAREDAERPGAYCIGLEESKLTEGLTMRDLHPENNGQRSGWLCQSCAIAHLRNQAAGEVTVNEEGDELELDGIKFVFT